MSEVKKNKFKKHSKYLKFIYLLKPIVRETVLIVMNLKEAGILNGAAYYTIKQVDIDGRFSYSTILKLSTASLINKYICLSKSV
jgi:hypothetical protein